MAVLAVIKKHCQKLSQTFLEPLLLLYHFNNLPLLYLIPVCSRKIVVEMQDPFKATMYHIFTISFLICQNVIYIYCLIFSLIHSFDL